MAPEDNPFGSHPFGDAPFGPRPDAPVQPVLTAPPSHPMGCGLVAPNQEFSALHCIFESQITG